MNEESFVLQTPEAWRFSGPAATPNNKHKAQSYLEERNIQHPNETPKSDETIWNLIDIENAVAEFAKDELRIDISKRLPPVEKFHFFQDFEPVRKTHNLNPRSVGTYTTSGNMLIETGQTNEWTLGNAQHELIHVAAYKRVDLFEDEESLQLKSAQHGYKSGKDGVFAPINEALTEITNMEVMTRYWKKYQTLSNLSIENYKNPAYLEAIIVTDGLIKMVANKENRPYREILLELIRGQFLGEMQTLRVFKNVLGTEGMKILAQWNHISDDPVKIAKALGLQDTVTKLCDYEDYKKIEILERYRFQVGIQKNT